MRAYVPAAPSDGATVTVSPLTMTSAEYPSKLLPDFVPSRRIGCRDHGFAF
jgi:hypothetical protein